MDENKHLVVFCVCERRLPACVSDWNWAIEPVTGPDRTWIFQAEHLKHIFARPTTGGAALLVTFRSRQRTIDEPNSGTYSSHCTRALDISFANRKLQPSSHYPPCPSPEVDELQVYVFMSSFVADALFLEED